MYLKSRGGIEYPSKSVIALNLVLLLCFSSFYAGIVPHNRYVFNGFLHFFEFGTFSFDCSSVWFVRKMQGKNKSFFFHWVLPYLESLGHIYLARNEVDTWLGYLYWGTFLLIYIYI